MINAGIRDGIYKVTLDDLKTFKSFLYRNFHGKDDYYEKMLPKLNQLDNFMALLTFINLTVLKI